MRVSSTSLHPDRASQTLTSLSLTPQAALLPPLALVAGLKGSTKGLRGDIIPPPPGVPPVKLVETEEREEEEGWLPREGK